MSPRLTEQRTISPRRFRLSFPLNADKNAFYAAGVVWLLAFAAWYAVPLPMPNVEKLTDIGAREFHPDFDVVIYLIAGVTAVLIGTIIRCWARMKSPPSVQFPVPTRADRFMSRVIDAVAILTVLGLVAVIAPEALAERTFNVDRFHHLNFYLMSPLHAYRHGAALGSDVYTQYGCGWILVFAFLGRFFIIDYPFVMGAMPLFGVAYFLAVYATLRLLTRSVLWSFFGLIACLQLQLYMGSDTPLWCFPSSTVLRCPTDLVVALALLSRHRYPRCAPIVSGGFAGMGVLFGTDTGIYLTAALLLFSVLCLRGLPSVSGKFSLAVMWASYLVVFTVGLFIASRGTFWQNRFWTGYFEAVLAYGGGFGALPIALMMVQPAYSALLFVMLMIYTLTLASSFTEFVRGTVTDRDRVLAFMATMGFGTLMLFINRSHPYNLFHPIIPACVLLIVYFSSRFPDRGGAISMADSFRQRSRLCVAVVVLEGILLLNPKVWDYPSIVSGMGRSLAGIPDPQKTQNLQALIAKAKTMADPLRQLEKLNRVVFVGEDPTVWLMTLDRPQMGRYCPAVLINNRQVLRMLDDFHARHPQVAIVTAYPALFGAIPNYFDRTWKTFYQDPEMSILLSPEYRAPQE